MRTPRLVGVLVLALAVGCHGTSDDLPVLKLNGIQVTTSGAVDAAALLDRDTTTQLQIDHPVDLTLHFSHRVDVQSVKVFGGAGVEVSGGGVRSGKGQGEAWTSLAVHGLPRDSFTVHLEPVAGSASVSELELWGKGFPQAVRDPARLAELSRTADTLPYEGVVELKLVDHVTLHPEGLNEGPSCQTLPFLTDLPLRSVRRAYLAFEANIPRAQGLSLSLNGGPTSGGFWLGKTVSTHTGVWEIDPAQLTGRDWFTLCVPAAADAALEVSRPRLLLLQDDGSAGFDRTSEGLLGAALDGDPSSAETFFAGSTDLQLERPMVFDRSRVDVESDSADLQLSAQVGAGWTAQPRQQIKKGWTELPGLGGPVQRSRIEVFGPARTDVPAASIGELAMSGSGIGPRLAVPQLVFTSPRLTHRQGQWVGERFADRAYVSGWAESPAGPGRVEIAGALVSNGDGSFGAQLPRPSDAPPSWKVTVKATFPDGTVLTRDLLLDDDRQQEVDDDLPSATDDPNLDARFGREGDTQWGKIQADKGGKVTLGTDVSFEAPAGAVSSETSIGISRRSPEAVPPLDPGMLNVSAPQGAGYRFTPHGRKFAKAVRVTLPYDSTLLPDGVAPEQIKTFFYDEDAQHWEALPTVQVRRGTSQVVSETTHFTFMVNAVLVQPEHPSPVSFNPNLMTGLKAADPSSGIDLIQPPSANSQGTTAVGYPIQIPRARGGFQPSVQVSYDSSGGDGWLGMGWTVAVSSVTVDTKFGVPYYDGLERYLLDGAELVPAGGATCADGSDGVLYRERVARTFDRILRCTRGRDLHFEVTDRGGTLFVYGLSAQARLTSYLDSTSAAVPMVAQWMLERAVDRHGNLVEYTYDTDRKDSGEAGEDFRQIYLSSIAYSGRIDRANPLGTPSAHGPFNVLFFPATDPREDVTVSGRFGFKVEMRQRLGLIRVTYNGGIIRQYALRYRKGDFDKSLLASVALFPGDGGTSAPTDEFYEHSFDYTTRDGGGFEPAVQQWGVDAWDDRGLSETTQDAVGVHAFAGIGFGPTRASGNVGVRFGFNHSSTNTHALMIDVNGDGLVDRLIDDGSGNLQVELNQATPNAAAASRSFGTRGPPGDPCQTVAPIPGQPLGSDKSDSFNAGIQATWGGGSLDVSDTFNWSHSSQFFIDADGDGLPDYLNSSQIRLGQLRATSQGCSSTFQFLESKAISGMLDGGLFTDASGNLAQARASIQDHAKPSDLLIEWTAPYAGTVDVSGVMQWVRPPALGAPHDGVRLRIYHSDPNGVLADDVPFELVKTPQSGDVPVAQSGIGVQPHDKLYFVLSTLADFPVQTELPDGGFQPRALEELRFSPSIHYTACSGACGSLTPQDSQLQDGTGSPLFTFDAHSDFRLGGGPFAVVTAAQSGTVHLEGTVRKPNPTEDDLRACAVVLPPPGTGANDQPLFVSCPRSGDAVLDIPAATTGDLAYRADVTVAQGGSVVLLVDSDVGFNPQGLSFPVSGAMTSICGGSPVTCRPPTPQEQARLSFTSYGNVRVHSSYTPTPVRPLVVPADGTLHYESFAYGDPSDPVVFTAREPGHLLFKHHGGEGASGDLQVHAGEQITFEAHTETARDPSFGDGWNLQLTLVRSGDGGTGVQPLQNVPRFSTYERLRLPLTQELIPKIESPFGGGYHDWRYGAWKGQTDAGMDPSLFYADPSGEDLSNIDETRARQLKDELEDGGSSLAQRTTLFAPLIPSVTGTQLVASAVGGDTAQGLMPRPAFVNQDGTTFASAEGTLLAGRQGGYVEANGTTTSVAALFDLGDIARASSGNNVSAGIGYGPLSGAISTGSASQESDVLDMNGDGIIDRVSAAGSGGAAVQLTDRHSLASGLPVDAPANLGFKPHESSEYSLRAGMGVSAPFKALNAFAESRGVRGMFSSSIGGGISLGESTVSAELTDINGDGLPDQVRVDPGTGDLLVRLNLGTSFATQDDRLSFNADDTSHDPLRSEVGGNLDQGSDQDSQIGSQALSGVFRLLDRQAPLQHSRTVTLEGNAGFVYGDEEYGVTVNTDTSVNATDSLLVDVNGDGLPDWVHRDVGGGSDFQVRLNTGYGFLPPRSWAAPEWGDGVPLPHLHPPGPFERLAELTGLDGAVDPVQATSQRAERVGAGFVVSYPILLSPFGTPWLILSAGADVAPKTASSFELGWMDINGDGVADQVLKTEANDAPPELYARVNASGGANLLSTIHRPLGGTVSIAYQRDGNTVDMPQSRYVLSQVSVSDGQNLAEPGHVLTSTFEYDDGFYDRAEKDFFGFGTVRTSRGDQRIVERFDNRTYYGKGNLLEDELFSADGRLFTRTAYQYTAPAAPSSPSLDCERTAPFSIASDSFCGWVFSPLQSEERSEYEGTVQDPSQPALLTTRKTYDGYDAFGNVTQFTEHGNVEDPSDDSTAMVTYFSSARTDALNLVSLPSEITVHAGGASGPILRDRTGTYDSNTGDLTQLSEAIDGSHAAVTGFAYDADGNLRTWTGPANAKGQRYALQYTYDDEVQTYVSQIVDAFGYESHASYDVARGNLLDTVDEGGNIDRREYDVFGRVVAVRAPTDLSGPPTASMEYAIHQFPAMAVTHNKLPPPALRSLDTVVFIDGMARPLQVKKTVEIDGDRVGYSVSGATKFDELGRVRSQGQLFFDDGGERTYLAPTLAPNDPVNPNPTLFAYDLLGRTTRVDAPGGETTRYTYQIVPAPGGGPAARQSVDTDPNGHVTAAYQDALGRQVAMEERTANGSAFTRYGYDAIGELTSVIDAANNVTHVSYDLLGRRLTLDNPDTGRVVTTYDPAGNLISRADANLLASGQAITYGYDYNRLASETRPHEDAITYRYGAPGTGNQAGRVIQITDEVGTEQRAYDALGQMTQTLRTIRPLKPGDRERVFDTHFNWDVYGRLLTLTYPDGEVLSYAYDAGGLVNAATSVRPSTSGHPLSETYLASMAYDVFGHRTLAKLGNGVQTRYAYDPQTLRLKHLSTVTPKGRVLQEVAYAYDKVGNVQSLDNQLPPAQGPHSGPEHYVFLYDELNQLTHAEGRTESRPGVWDRFTSDFQYSAIHNMTWNSQVREVLRKGDSLVHIEKPETSNHAWAYTYGSPHPHQATQIGPVSLVYDASGNTTLECRAPLSKDPSVCPDAIGQGHLTRYLWGDAGELRTAVHDSGGHLTRYLYDASGERVVKEGVGGESLTIGPWYSVRGHSFATKHIFIGETRLASKLLPSSSVATGTAGGTPTSEPPGCVPSGETPQKCPVVTGGPLAAGTGQGFRPATYYYHADHLGSTSWVTDANGLVHEHVEYYPYGEDWREPRSDDDKGPSLRTPYLFTSKEYDSETGLTYFGARYYDSKKARWISPDPALERFLDEGPNARGALFPGELSLFAYAMNNPSVLRDPDGRETVGELIERKGVQAAGEGRNVAAFGWAYASAAWSIFGAEGVSRVTDNKLQGKAVSGRQWFQAGIEVAAVIPIPGLKAESVVAKQVERKALAEGGEQAARLIEHQAGAGASAAAKGADAYSGIKAASKYLQEAGVSRAKRVEILQSFEAGTVSLRQAGASEFGLRYFDGLNAAEKGRYLFETFPASRSSLALKPEWNQMTRLAQWRIAPGTMLIEGRAAAQGLGLEGGAVQKFLLDTGNLLKP